MGVILVKLDKKTAKRVKSFKITRRESYDEIINRILDNQKKEKE